MDTHTLDVISFDEAQTLAGLFRARVKRSPQWPAYRYFDENSHGWLETTWGTMGAWVARVQAALKKEGLQRGDRVGIMLRNSREWVVMDQAALGLGLVVVPLYTDDRAENVAYIINDAQIKLLLLGGQEQCNRLLRVKGGLPGVEKILTVEQCQQDMDPRLDWLESWVSDEPAELLAEDAGLDELATIVYTSGTTGRPKGVMLSHRNILSNVAAALEVFIIYPDDTFMSFLPLSHTFERTCGYYLTIMSGSRVAYARSIAQLAEDLIQVGPTVLISVPRIFERVYNRISEQMSHKPVAVQKLFAAAVNVGWHRFQFKQGRVSWHPKQLLWPLLDLLVARKIKAKLGGRLRLTISGGAALNGQVARVFIGLGLNLCQGYGLTESSPVITASPMDDNIPESIGKAFPGVEVDISADGELLARGPNIMQGYWHMPEASAAAIDKDGWLHTGDKARCDDGGHYFITGRIKEIIVLANGEKVPPSDIEMAIAMDPLFEQVMLVGEARPFLAVVAVLNADHLDEMLRDKGITDTHAEACSRKDVQAEVLEHIGHRMSAFPGYAHVHRVILDMNPWTVDDGLLTPTLKLRRERILEHYQQQIDAIYAGH